MLLRKNLLLSLSLLGSGLFAQHAHRLPEGSPKTFFYATMDADHAEKLKFLHPQDVKIVQRTNNEAAVHLSNHAASDLHQFVLSHGPGFIQHPSKEQALEYVQRPQDRNLSVLNFNITEDEWVNQLINQVKEENIESLILAFESIHTRHHLSTTNNVGMDYIKNKWQEIIDASGRNDLKVEFFTHRNTPQKSVIFTIEGNEEASEFIIIGGHADSIVSASWSGNYELRSPGADDNASGIATITEALRVLVENGFKPKKTIQIMAFAAEEVGLVGSNEIATKYKNEGKNVKAYVQFDMTNYKGSTKDVYITTDSYNSNDLNLFLVELMEHYNSKADQNAFTYGYTVCNYGCSDHASWANRGFPSAFPFEASFHDSNPYIHSANDTYARSNNSSSHAAKFVKLALEFLVEAAKPSADLGLDNVIHPTSKIAVHQKSLHYQLDKKMLNNRVKILSPTGQTVYQASELKSDGSLDLSALTSGLYIAIFESSHGGKFTSKFLLK
ncbi:M20/M25/M40 family metallo-hydrolase [Vaginella massiliensis]|uniref:M20/M25/M40 family metallo-hydrolase n=1 Tax=Vaginella massiliensis TaxID=1816680 RepID=UPI000B07E0BD|nr:M20/M25/M40 family metallo-hydrolase [Vaginella massiliensis]